MAQTVINLSPYLLYPIAIYFVIYLLQQILLYFPIFHRRPRPSKDSPLLRAQKIAHRGCREEGLPENSQAAFSHAIKHNADVLECDVWLTSDHEVVIFHNATTLEMTGVDEKIINFQYKDLPLLNTENRHHQHYACHQYPTEYITKIPTLKQVLSLLPPDKMINIEFKQSSWELIQKVHSTIRHHHCLERKQVFWFSLDEKINKNLRQADPKIPTIVSIEGMLKVLVMYYVGILPFVEIKDAVFGITLEEISLQKIREEKAIANLPDWIKQILAYCFRGRPPYAMLAPKLFTHLRRRGIPIWFLNVNSEEDLKLAVEAGATGVLTDRIAWLDETLKTNGWKFKNLYE